MRLHVHHQLVCRGHPAIANRALHRFWVDLGVDRIGGACCVSGLLELLVAHEKQAHQTVGLHARKILLEQKLRQLPARELHHRQRAVQQDANHGAIVFLVVGARGGGQTGAAPVACELTHHTPQRWIELVEGRRVLRLRRLHCWSLAFISQPLHQLPCRNSVATAHYSRAHSVVFLRRVFRSVLCVQRCL
jgi:hypothetical protein